MVVIVVSGVPGAGSSTVARLVADKLDLEFFSAGDYFKKLSKKHSEGEERTMKFWQTEEGHSQELHEHIDSLTKRAADKGNVVIDAKIGIRILKERADLSVWLKASMVVRAKRHAKRGKVDSKNSLFYIEKRTRLERKHWREIYGFDYFDQEKEADLVIDSSSKSPEKIVEEIVDKLEK